jgi:hypothetical protein
VATHCSLFVTFDTATDDICHLAGNRLLLLTQVITEEFASSYVTRVHPRHGVIHQEDFANACGLRDCAVGLPKVVAPLRKRGSVLFVLDNMPADAISRKPKA